MIMLRKLRNKNYKEEFSHYSVEKKTIKEFKKDILEAIFMMIPGR